MTTGKVGMKWRLDPFENEYQTSTIADEPHKVAFHNNINRYGFYLYEAPEIVVGGNSLTVTEDVSGGATWDELGSSTAPSAGEYRLDKFFNTGFVEFHSGDNAKKFLVDYTGKGSIPNPDYMRRYVWRAGEIKFISTSLTGAETLAEWNAMGWAALNGTTVASQLTNFLTSEYAISGTLPTYTDTISPTGQTGTYIVFCLTSD